MINVMAKRIQDKKRQIMVLFYILLRFIRIKENPKLAEQGGKQLYLFAGRASPVSTGNKNVLQFLFKVRNIIAADPIVSKCMQIVFIPNYGIAVLEKLVASADISIHITTPG